MKAYCLVVYIKFILQLELVMHHQGLPRLLFLDPVQRLKCWKASKMHLSLADMIDKAVGYLLSDEISCNSLYCVLFLELHEA